MDQLKDNKIFLGVVILAIVAALAFVVINLTSNNTVGGSGKPPALPPEAKAEMQRQAIGGRGAVGGGGGIGPPEASGARVPVQSR